MSKGFGLIEIIVGSAILTVSLAAVATYFQKSLQFNQDNKKIVQASFLLEEGLEVVKFFRDTSWLNISGLTSNTSYYLKFDGTKWATSTSNVFVDNLFERKLVINNVSRDANDDIVSSGGTNDADTKRRPFRFLGEEETARQLSQFQLTLPIFLKKWQKLNTLNRTWAFG